MNTDVSPYFKEIISDAMEAHQQNNPKAPSEVTKYLTGGKPNKQYIAMKKASGGKRHLVHFDDDNHKYILQKGAKVLLSSIRGKYVYVSM